MTEFLNLILSNLPWFWLGIMVLCLVFEAVTFSLTTVWAALSALLMIFLSRTGLPLRWQLLIFFLVTILLLAFTRPFAVKKLRLGRLATNVNSLDGQEVLVVKKITKFEKGEVKASNGVLWTALGEGSDEISKGSVCKVVRVEGNTLVVREK
ncbi:MAG: NfeD family protein [Treponema sp.]|nr:NfeD family protein [Treponema sp.]